MLGGLASVAAWDPQLAGRALSNLNTRSRDLDHYFLNAISHLIDTRPRIFEQLISQSWLNDGLDDEEMGFIVATHRASADLFSDLIEHHSTNKKTIPMPLAGEINIWIFHDDTVPLKQDVPSIIGDAAQFAEEFLGAPFPTTDVILLVLPDTYSHAGQHARTHMELRRFYDGTVPSIVHETAHYYFGFEPAWLAEGGAEFIASYYQYLSGSESLSVLRDDVWELVQGNCAIRGIANIQELLDFRQDASAGTCKYWLGEFFLFALYDTLGDDALGSALGDLYLLAESSLGDLYLLRDRSQEFLTEQAIYEVFLKNVPPGIEEEFRGVYGRIHGGTVGPPEFPTGSPYVSEKFIPEIRSALSWADTPPDAYHAHALQALEGLWNLNADVGMAVVRYRWVVDGVTRIEASALRDLGLWLLRT